MRRIPISCKAAVTAALLGGCSQTTGPEGSLRALGILHIEADSVIQAPDTVEVGQTFDVTVYTIGPNGCWSADGLDKVASDRVIELIPWDRRSGADFCTLVLGFLSHTMSLAINERGAWTVRAVGRRFGSDGGSDGSATAERTIFVRPPYSSEQPLEVRMAIGEEILVDGLFRVTFSDVSEDSRCPVDVVCVWEGNAVVVVGLTLGTGPTHPFSLNTLLEPRSAEHGIYRVSLVGLVPESRSSTPIDRGSYRATLRIEAVR